ncbi:hypothetical protein AGMMS4957_18580 [Bacteroidia bacterium]|nr:hypothetical protein AGMMS4957_18580 [Bacteroidia bacterium]
MYKKINVLIVVVVSGLFLINCKSATKAAQSENDDIYGKIFEAIKSNDESAFQKLVAEVNNLDTLITVNEDEAYSILGYCCKYKRCLFAEKLLDMGANTNLVQTVMMYAFDALSVALGREQQDICLATLLLKRGCNPNAIYSEDGLTPLGVCCELGNYELSELLIDFGANVNGNGYTEGTDYVFFPILLAIESSNVKLVELLIEKGANLDVCDTQGETPLSVARRTNNKEIESILLKSLDLTDGEKEEIIIN